MSINNLWSSESDENTKKVTIMDDDYININLMRSKVFTGDGPPD